MDKQYSDSDSQEDRILPGILFASDESSSSTDLHHHISHQHKHSLSYTPPSLVEVRFHLLKKKKIFFFSLV